MWVFQCLALGATLLTVVRGQRVPDAPDCTGPRDFSIQNDKNAIDTNIRFQCSNVAATTVKKFNASQCLQDANLDFYNRAKGYISPGGPCADIYMPDGPQTDLSGFCRKMTTRYEATAQQLVRCLAVNYGCYPDPDVLAATPSCQALDTNRQNQNPPVVPGFAPVTRDEIQIPQ